MLRTRRHACAVSLLFLGLAGCVLGPSPLAASTADEPWDAGAFAADPAQIIHAVHRIDEVAAPASAENESGVEILLSEARYSFDDSGRQTYVRRFVYRILNASAHEGWSTIEEAWSPWHQERPQLRARVITPDGVAHGLEPSTLSEAALSQDPTLFQDGRILRAPLPATGPGAVVEQEVRVRETAPYFARGTVETFPVQLLVPVRHARLVLEAPEGLPLRHLVKQLPETAPREESVSGRRRLTFEYRDLPAMPDLEPGLPPEAPRVSSVMFSTGGSWTEIAREYSAIVDQAIQKADSAPELAAFLRSAGGPAPAQIETINRLLSRMGREIRYTGLELGDGGIVPRSPGETLKRKFGDCKDKAVLLSALLRAQDIPAYVALLKAGEGISDVEESLPGLGGFNHAIVFVPGATPIWIDPTDPYARAGELPAGDQGRLALIASPAASGLVRTPEATPAENREIETREFYLADFGKARVVETTEYRGAIERAMRSYYAAREPKALRDELTSYVGVAYRAKELSKLEHTDPADLAKPFRLRLEMAEAGGGMTDLQTAAVQVFPQALLSRLPGELHPQEGKKAEPRRSDYYFTRPASVEARYRAIPPAGFRPQPLPEARSRQWGPAVLSEEYVAGEDGTVTATLRFEVGKRRLTPQEFEALRDGVRGLWEENGVMIRFSQVGQERLASGQVREALDEFRRLQAQAPKELQKKALPHVRIALALLAGGMRDAALEEIRTAVALEPSSALAQSQLSWVLQHDELGRHLGKGFDRKGALAAYRKAKELDPQDAEIRRNLAILLEFDDDGARYTEGADLAAAIEEYRALRKDLDSSSMEDDNLAVALLRAERFTELKELLDGIEETESRTTLRLVAVAILEGADASMREAERKISDGEKRQQILEATATNLSIVRHYKEAAALLERVGRQASNAAETLARAELMRKVRRHEEVKPSATDPAEVLERLLLAAMSSPPDPESFRSLWSRALREGIGQDKEKGDREIKSSFLAGFGRSLNPAEMSADVFLDFGLLAFRKAVSGDDAVGYRIGLTESVSGRQVMKFFVVPEDGEYKIAGFSFSLETLGSEALRRLESNDLAGARQWLGWAREEVRLPGEKDALGAAPLAFLWKDGAGAEAGDIRCAAASLLADGGESAKAIPLLLPCREAASSDIRKTAVDLALAAAYLKEDRNAELLEVAQRLIATEPTSERANFFLYRALENLGRWDEVRQVAEKRLAAAPDDLQALERLAIAAERRGDLEEADRIWQRSVDTGKAGSAFFNNLAWLCLVRGKVDDRALANGQRAATLSEYRSYAAFHTLASLYAELGKTAEAYQLILQGLASKAEGAPDSDDWYVFGRLAEHYGLPEAARRYYERVSAPGPRDVEVASAFRLARQRLALLPAKPQEKRARQ